MAELSHGRIDYSDFERAAPDVNTALRMLGKAVEESGLDKQLMELLKLRASQINNCAFCLQYHLNQARKLGVATAKLDLLATWREAGIFSPREYTALAWTEALTLIGHHSVSDTVYAGLKAEFSNSEIAFLSSAIALINAWNRIAGALQFTPPIPKESLIERD